LAPFNGAEFPYAFLTAFGNKGATIKRLRKGDTNASDVPGGVLQVDYRTDLVRKPEAPPDELFGVRSTALLRE
jgi:hypothetical protein